MDRGKLGTKRSVMTDTTRIPIGCPIAPANRHDSPLLCPSYQGIISIKAFIALANAIIITRRLIHTTWTTHRWDTRPKRRP